MCGFLPSFISLLEFSFVKTMATKSLPFCGEKKEKEGEKDSKTETKK